MRVYNREQVAAMIALTFALTCNLCVLFADMRDKTTDIFSLYSVIILMVGAGGMVYMLAAGGVDIEGGEDGNDDDNLPEQGGDER